MHANNSTHIHADSRAFLCPRQAHNPTAPLLFFICVVRDEASLSPLLEGGVVGPVRGGARADLVLLLLLLLPPQAGGAVVDEPQDVEAPERARARRVRRVE